MATPARNAALMLLAAAVAWAILTATPAVAEPGDTGTATPTVGGSTALPLMRAVDPVVTRLDGIWNQFLPPNAIVPWTPVSAFQQFVEPFIPTTTQVGDFAAVIQPFGPPVRNTPPIG